MTNAKIDDNWKPTLIGVRSTDGDTPIRAEIDPVSGGLLVDIVAGGSSGNVNIAQVGGSSISLGQTTKSASLPITLANDQGTLAVQDSAAESSLSTIATNTTALSTSSNQTNGTQQTKLTDGTNIANILAGDTGYNSIVAASGTKTYTFTTSTPGAQTILANTPCSGYSWIEIVYSSVGSGLALTGQYSAISGGTYVNSSSFSSAATSTATSSLGVAANTLYVGPIRGTFFQIAVSALTSGTFTGVIILSTFAPPLSAIASSQSGTWSIGANSATGSAVPANAFYMGLKDSSGNLVGALSQPAGDATSTAGSLMENLIIFNGTNYDRLRAASSVNNTTGTGLLGAGMLEFDGTNYQRVPSARFAPSTTSLNTYSVHLTSNTTTTPTSSTAYISSISISNEVGGTTSTVTIQDKQGTPLKLVNGLATTALTTTPTAINFQTPVKMVSGIDIITAGAVAATIDVWINYYQ